MAPPPCQSGLLTTYPSLTDQVFSLVEEDPAKRQHFVGEDSYHHHDDGDEHYHKGMATMILIAQV